MGNGKSTIENGKKGTSFMTLVNFHYNEHCVKY